MTNFKVGDKARMLRKERICGADCTQNGEIYDVVEMWGKHDILIDDKSGGETLLIVKSELHAIEKVEPDTLKYRTVKREAIVGERILVTDAKATGGYYSNSNVFTVESQCPIVPSLVYVVEHGKPIDRLEYEVIIEEAPPNRKTDDRISALEAEVETLKAQVYSLEKNKAEKPSVNVTINASSEKIAPDFNRALSEVSRIMANLSKLSPNQQRKAVIERAKAFVADVERRAIGDTANADGNRTFNTRTTKLTFHVNAEKRVVTALAHGANYRVLCGKAFAKCAPDDVFNADIGKAIAAGRLYGLDVSEFERAVQPTEVVVGMCVRGKYAISKKVLRIELAHGDRRLWREGDGYVRENLASITDDTEAQY